MKKEQIMLYSVGGLVAVAIIVLIGVSISGLSNKSNAGKNVIEKETETITQVIEEYNKEMVGLIKHINTDENIIEFYDIINNKEMNLTYAQGMIILDKYGLDITLSRLTSGEIVNIDYDNTANRISSIKISDKAWEYKEITELNIDKSKKGMNILGTDYKYTENLIILSNDKQISLLELSNKDEYTVKGYGQILYSIIVDKGHGYIKLSNYEDFIGGVLELGFDMILPVTEDLLIVAQEGNYKITISNNDLQGSKNVNVVRDQEINVDMSEFRRPPVKIGGIDFIINPIGSELYIDGKETDYEDVIMLEYGKHEIIVKCSGYTSYAEELTVDSAYLALNIQLKDPKDQSNSITESSTIPTTRANANNNATEPETTEPTINQPDISVGRIDENNAIYIQKPAGASVYLNGTNMGTSPLNFTKQTGTHIITLSQSGYVTKSYTIEVTDDDNDAYFSFPDMDKK